MTARSSGPRALVLGGGGITGIAWELGLLAGLAERGVDLTVADRVIGTSAGSVVGAKITSGRPIEELYAEQLNPPTDERRAEFGWRQLGAYAWAMLRSGRDLEAFGVRMGRLAIRTAAGGQIPTHDVRLRIIESRLPSTVWPDRSLTVTTVDAASGAFVTFDAGSGVSLVDAVAASCAVPGVYPPAVIEGRPYIDGGMRSPANVDLAQGCAQVVALTPIAGAAGPLASAQSQVDRLGVPGEVVTPDREARAAIGRNTLDPAARAASARAGRRQAAAVSERIARVWGSSH